MRKRRKQSKLRFAKLGSLFLILLLALGSMGISYSLWSKDIQVELNINTGEWDATIGDFVWLDIDEDGNSIKLYVDGPFRKQDGSINHRGWRHYGYEVIYDIELKVPYETDFYLKTVNEGEIRIEDVTGAYEVENINGGIQMENVGGSGRVYALNGEVEITFSKNPEDSSYFGSLNGDINVSFQSGFAADVQIKTFNGEAYSDFPFTYLPTPIEKGKRKRGKYVYKSNKGAMVRVGKGGPYVKFDAFNGDIYIREI